MTGRKRDVRATRQAHGRGVKQLNTIFGWSPILATSPRHAQADAKAKKRRRTARASRRKNRP